MLLEEELTYRIQGCVFEVNKHLGHGFLESIYHNAMLHELRSAGLAVETEKPVSVLYKGKSVGEHRLDLVVESKVILELKAQSRLNLGAEAQLLNYMKASRIPLGMLINFTAPRATIKRLVL
jgi:GxxExxY protein